ncbi:hypothetical protein HG531_011139 [Fusarium graminearum]|nr:hypothetical protein HG531_011139 [Fusarium graminearum]
MGNITLFLLHSARQAITLLWVQLEFGIALLLGIKFSQDLIIQALVTFRKNQNISAHLVTRRICCTEFRLFERLGYPPLLEGNVHLGNVFEIGCERRTSSTGPSSAEVDGVDTLAASGTELFPSSMLDAFRLPRAEGDSCSGFSGFGLESDFCDWSCALSTLAALLLATFASGAVLRFTTISIFVAVDLFRMARTALTSSATIDLILELSSFEVSFTSILLFFSSFENIVFLLRQAIQDDLSSFEINMAILGNIATHDWQIILPNLGQGVDSMLPNLESRKMRFESNAFIFLIMLAVLLLLLATTILRIVALLATDLAEAGFLILKEYVFTQDSEMRLVGCKSKHDKISI